MADLEEEPSGDFAPQSVGAGEEAGGEANGDAASSKHASPSTDSEHEGDLDGEGDDATNGDADDENMEDKDDTEAALAALQAEIDQLSGASDLNFDLGITSSPLNGATSSPTAGGLVEEASSLLAAADGLVAASAATTSPNNGMSSSEPIMLDETEKQSINALSEQVDEHQDAEETDSRSVYVGNVDYSCTEDQLARFFSSCGTVERATILRDKYTQQPKGYAYVQFKDARAIDNALQLASSELNGRQLKVDRKRKNVPFYMRGGRGRGRGRGYRGRRPYRGGYRGRGGYAPRYRGRRSRGYHPYSEY